MKRFWIIFLFVFPLVFCSGCSLLGHKINTPDKDLMDECPKRARAGTTVHFTTVTVCDAILHVDLEGADLVTIHEGEYEFVMPDHEVSIRVWITGMDNGGGS